MANESVRNSGIDDLLPCPINASRLPEAELRRLEGAASRVREPLQGGLEAIGTLLWQAAASKDIEISNDTLFRLGAFIEQLSEVQERLSSIELNAWQVRALRAEQRLAAIDAAGIVAVPEYRPPTRAGRARPTTRPND